MTTPARANDHCTRPEQSKSVGPSPPHTYGMPSLLSAASRNATTSALVRPGPSAAAPAIPAAPPVSARPDEADSATSDATAAFRGSSFLICFISVLRSACGALITIALSAGIPSERATASETTASTPPTPPVQGPATGSASAGRPYTRTARPSGRLSSLLMVYETATPPAATFFQRP